MMYHQLACIYTVAMAPFTASYHTCTIVTIRMGIEWTKGDACCIWLIMLPSKAINYYDTYTNTRRQSILMYV